MKLKKAIASTLVASMCVGAFAGCNSKDKTESTSAPSNDSTENTTTKTDDSTSSANAQKITLWLTPQWKGVMDASEDGADYDSFFKYAANDFKTRSGGIDVGVEVIPADQRTEMLNVNVQSGTPPDIMFEGIFTLGDFVHRGNLLPIDDIIDEESKNDIDSGIWENVKYGDNYYMFPYMHNEGTIVYNADMFKAAGLEQYIGGENEIKTWTLEEYETILTKLKETLPTGKYPMALFAGNDQGDTWNLAYLRMFGNTFFDENSNIVVNQPDGVQGMEWMKKVYDNGWSNPGAETTTSNDCNSMFQNQQLAISFTNSILFNNLREDMKNGKVPAFDARLCNIPSSSGDPLTFTYVTGAVLFDTKDDNRIKASKDFVKFFSTDADLVMASKNSVPVRSSVADKVSAESPILKAYVDNSKYLFNFTGNVPSYLQLRQILFPAIQSVYIGDKTSQQALDDYAAEGNKIIEAGKTDSAIYK